MSQTSKGKDERVFTIELKSKGDVKNVTLDGGERVFIEGTLGSFRRAHFLWKTLFWKWSEATES